LSRTLPLKELTATTQALLTATPSATSKERMASVN